MATIVLAAGAVMVILGGLAIFTGYPIIQIERGWATVIAGTSLLAGGTVTMALSLVLRALMDLRHALMVPRTSLTATDDVGGAAPAMEPRIDPTAEEMTLHRDPAVAAVAVPAMAVFARPESGETHPSEAHPDETPPDETKAHAFEPPVEQTYPPVAEDAPRPAEVLHAESPAPHLDDWLDRAFATLPVPSARAESLTSKRADSEPRRAEPVNIEDTESVEPMMEHAPATQLHDDHVEPSVDVYAPHHHEPNHHEQIHEAHAMEHAHADTAPPVPEEPTSAVIGRYEADGTSYTMYADGSIEAQSDAGIYRFASMSELKAFIEG